MNIREIVDATLVAPMREQAAQHEITRLRAINAELLSCLKAIQYEYDNTYDVDQQSDGYWHAAASIPVEVMEHAERLIKKHG
jgi:hypothetical protein